MMSDCSLNLTKIQSLPVIQTPGKYAFVDITFNSVDNTIKQKKFEIMAQEFKVLGEYKLKNYECRSNWIRINRGSIALKIKEIDANTVIYGLDKNMDSLSYSLSKGIIDKKLDINSIDNLKYIFIAIL